jgi:hypothetical protein
LGVAGVSLRRHWHLGAGAAESVGTPA